MTQAEIFGLFDSARPAARSATWPDVQMTAPGMPPPPGNLPGSQTPASLVPKLQQEPPQHVARRRGPRGSALRINASAMLPQGPRSAATWGVAVNVARVKPITASRSRKRIVEARLGDRVLSVGVGLDGRGSRT